jgi:hypothetical protein
MLTTDQINDLHHLYWVARWPIRKIEQHLRMSWHTIKKYLEAPAQTPATRSRVSKLDPLQTHHRRTAGEGLPGQCGCN